MYIQDLIDKSQVNCDNVTSMAARAERLAGALLDWYPPPGTDIAATQPSGVVPQLNTIQTDLASSIDRLDYALMALGDCLLGVSPSKELCPPVATSKRPPEPTRSIEDLLAADTKRMAQKFAPAGARNAVDG